MIDLSWEDQQIAYVLAHIGGWRPGCPYEVENQSAVDQIRQRGYVTLRTHYAPAIPEGEPAYELTEAGLKQLALLSGEEAARRAEAMRQWYRDYTHGPRWTPTSSV